MRARRQRNLSRHQKFFAKTSFTERLPPLWDGTIFGQVFVRGPMTKFQKWKVPLHGGQSRGSNLLDGLTALKLASVHCSAPRRLIARSPEMRWTVPVPIPSDLATLPFSRARSGAIAPVHPRSRFAARFFACRNRDAFKSH